MIICFGVLKGLHGLCRQSIVPRAISIATHGPNGMASRIADSDYFVTRKTENQNAGRYICIVYVYVYIYNFVFVYLQFCICYTILYLYIIQWWNLLAFAKPRLSIKSIHAKYNSRAHHKTCFFFFFFWSLPYVPFCLVATSIAQSMAHINMTSQD